MLKTEGLDHSRKLYLPYKNSNIYSICFILIVIFLSLTEAGETIEVGDQVSGLLVPRQNIVWEINTCQNIDVEIEVQGSLLIEAGPHRQSFTNFQSTVRLEVSDEKVNFKINYPLISGLKQIYVCKIYVSLYGKLNEVETQFKLRTSYRVIDEISFVSLKSVDANISSLGIYTNPPQFHSSQFYIISDTSQKKLKIHVYYSLENNQQDFNPLIGLPKAGFVKEPKESQSELEKSLSSQNNFLNRNFEIEVEEISNNKILFMLEKEDESPPMIFSILPVQFSQFQPLFIYQNNQNQFSGLNFHLNKCQKKLILINNKGDLLIQIFSPNLTKIKVYHNLSNNQQSSKECLQSTQIETTKINSQTTQFRIIFSSINDTLLLEATDDDVYGLIELKPYISSISNFEYDGQIQINNNGFIVTVIPIIQNATNQNNSTLVKTFIFISEDEEAVSLNSLIGESQQQILYFAEVDSSNIDLLQIKQQIKEEKQNLFMVVRGYDSFNRVYLSLPLDITELLKGEGKTLKIIEIIILISIVLAIVLFTFRIIKQRNQNNQQDEVELMQSSVHIKMSP